MAAIFETINIEWAGESYEITPTFKLIQQIERSGISLAQLANRAANNDVPLSIVADVYAQVLSFGGCKTSPEEVYTAIFNTDENIVTNAINMILSAFFPKSESESALKKRRKTKK